MTGFARRQVEVTSFRSPLLDGDETGHVQPGSGAHREVAADRFPSRPMASDRFSLVAKVRISYP